MSEGEMDPATRLAAVSWWRQPRWLAAGAVVLVLVLAAAVLAYTRGEEPTAQRRLRAPFDQAIARLAEAPAVHYRASNAGIGGLTMDLRITRFGDSIGSMSLAGQKFELLTMDGKSYFKSPSAIAGPSKDRWTTGGLGATMGSQAQAQTPSDLAATLRSGLNDHATLPSASTPATVVDGVPAIKAVTRRGDLYVTRDAPHRVLKLSPNAASESARPSLPSVPSLPPLPSLPDIPAMPSMPVLGFGGGLAGRASAQVVPKSPVALKAPSALGTLDFPAVSEADLKSLFADLEKEAKTLSKAVNADINFALQGNADVKCGGGCTVTATVKGSVTSTNRDARIRGGKVRAQLTATVQIEGLPAGSCTTTRQLPLNSRGVIRCKPPGSGAVLARVRAQKRALAQAQSRASGGRAVPYTIQITGQANVEAIAQVNVAVLVRALRQELELLSRLGEADGEPAPQSEPSATPQPQPDPQPTMDDDRVKCPPPPPGHVRSGGGWTVNSSGPGGRAGLAMACFQAPIVSVTTNPTNPVGWDAAKKRAKAWGFRSNELARCHLLPAQLGGSNTDKRNFVPCFQGDVNVGEEGMRQFEDAAAAAIRPYPDRVLIYEVKPEYVAPNRTSPYAITMRARAFDKNGTVVYHNFKTVLNHRFRGDLHNLGE